MKNNRTILFAVLSLVFVTLLVACGDSSDDSNAKSDNQSQNNKSTEVTDNDSIEVDTTEVASTTENGNSESINKESDSSEKEDTSNTVITEEDTTSLKEDYLKKLNKMEEEDRYGEVGTTISELEEQELERYSKWDNELNEIYGIIEAQLSTEQMDKLREEQREWITQRDEEAKESSLKYKGGSTESLEYVATQASLTRERCYALVAKYL